MVKFGPHKSRIPVRIWASPPFEGYTVDCDANVYKGDYRLMPQNNGLGYFQVRFRFNKRRYSKYLHRIVWESFNGEVPNGYEINHIDHDKSNNTLNNLELVTRSENVKKAIEVYGYWGCFSKFNK